MFDIGFSELMVIALVGLIVIGPERLPRVARTVGHLLGRLQRYVSDVKNDISREMQIEDLKRLQAQVAEQARSLERQVNEQLKTVETELNQSILDSAAKNAVDASVEAAKPFTPPLPAESSVPTTASDTPRTPPAA
ncbi:Sec-independent protein translocase protein TatB [Sulfuricystis multivorans]|uniref:Sec-independent protein translocase protein TatB n=1 Tax=Sulfuricystis multivorans TaxID=2211108 RepID=UPI000F839ABF|nr:Sec-independent protein translocase protein TatB [Sulfuricystis multivorans]